jgi:hypothetical protein
MQLLKSVQKYFFWWRQNLFVSLLVFSWITTGYSASSQPLSNKEYEIKAAFLFNFTQFVEWPEHSFPVAKSPFIIGILGEDPFGSVLEEIVAGEKVKGHPVIIQHYYSAHDFRNCQILYVAAESQELFRNCLNKVNEQNVLTVSDIPDFTDSGGMIEFILENKKIRLRINLDRARNAGLSIDSRLLRLAQIVSPKKN